MQGELITGLVALGVGLGSGAAGALATHYTYKRRRMAEVIERRRENTTEAIQTAVREALSQSMEYHLGAKNGEIKQDIADIKAFITVACPSTHKHVDARLNRIEILQQGNHL